VDPVSLIVAALAAGAAAGAKDTVTSLVKDAYAGLKALVRRHFAGRSSGEVALERHESNPEAWRSALEAELADAGAGRDNDLLTAAQRLMALLDPEGTRAGKYQVDARGAQGVQIGDHGTQSNIFNTPPPA
jgi:hypothetical protein